MAVSKAACVWWQMCLTDLLRSNQKTDAHSMKDKKRDHRIASCCRFESCSQRLSHADTNIIVVTAPWIFNVMQWKFDLCFFFCETVSALLRHSYICTHRCAFNADNVYIIRYIYIIYIGVIDIIFGPLKSFTNSSRWSFYIYINNLFIHIYPCPATCPATWRCTSSNSPNSWGPGQSQETFFCAVGGTHFPKGWTCEANFMTALKASKQEQPQVWVIFWGINHGSGGNGNWFPPRLLPLYKTAF